MICTQCGSVLGKNNKTHVCKAENIPSDNGEKEITTKDVTK